LAIFSPKEINLAMVIATLSSPDFKSFMNLRCEEILKQSLSSRLHPNLDAMKAPVEDEEKIIYS